MTGGRNALILSVVGVLLVQIAAVGSLWRDVRSGKADFAYLHAAAIEFVHGEQVPVQQPDRLHPPFELLVFAPLATLPYPAAFVAWYLCNILMLAASIVLLWNDIGGLRHRFAWVLIPLFTCFPVLVTLLQGQDSILLLLLLAICFRRLKEGHEFSAGVALALGMFKFLLVLPIVAALAFARKWRLVAGYLSTCAVLLLVSVALVGPEGVTGYVRLLLGQGRLASHGQAGTEVTLMPNLHGVFTLFLTGRVSPVAISGAIAVISLAVLLLAALRWVKGESRCADLNLRFAMLVSAAVIISYHLFAHNAVILLLPLLLCSAPLLSFAYPSWVRPAFLCSAGVMYLAPFIAPTGFSMPVFFFGVLVFFSVLYQAAGGVRDHSVSLPERAESVVPMRSRFSGD